MQNLFSHAHEPDYVAPTTVEQHEISVVIDVPADQAFDGFTDGIHLWWPVTEQTIFGEGSHVALLRDHLVEESDDGEEVIWAELADWDAPKHLGLVWVLDPRVGSSPEIDISFELADGGMTRVRVAYAQPSESQATDDETFSCDWPLILSRYARFMGGAVQLD